ncbi:MAG: guanosine monophosphate reductase, partial [Spirochaetia bacterium]|nr:guanosine monophosphate reductase [Spirochaetia bacterium]
MEFIEALGYDDISLLPNFSDIISRKEVNTITKISKSKYIDIPIILSPMDTVSSVKSCIKINRVGGAGVLHRFMSPDDQAKKAKHIKDESNFCINAIGLKDFKERIEMISEYTDIFFLDTANGLSQNVEDFLIWYKQSSYKQDIIVGNTLTKESVYRLANLKSDGFRHLIGPGSMCLTQIKTGIGCPSVTGLYYAWKAVRNFQLANLDYFRHENPKEENRPSILADGGIRYPKDLVKAIASGADAVICGRIFAGLADSVDEENIIEKDGKRYAKYRGMASKDVVEDYDLYDGTKKNLFVEGDATLIPLIENKSIEDIVYDFANGLRSAMSY